MDLPTFAALEYAVADGVAWVRLNRPDALNSFTTMLYAEVRDAMRLADLDCSVDCVVVTGTGRAFATGGDLKEVLSYAENETDPLLLYRFTDNLPFEAIRACSKVTIAAVNGLCMAGGVITAACCDIVIAVESASFALPEARVGLAEPFVPALLFGKVSLTQLKYLLFTAEAISATEAERIGLVTKVVADGELEATVRDVIRRTRTTSRSARAAYKNYFDQLLPRIVAFDTIGLVRTEPAVRMLRSFAEKRSPSGDAKPGNQTAEAPII